MKQVIQLVIVVGFLLLMAAALIIDGAFGERAFGMLLGGFGLVLGYFFRKSGEAAPPQPPAIAG